MVGWCSVGGPVAVDNGGEAELAAFLKAEAPLLPAAPALLLKPPLRQRRRSDPPQVARKVLSNKN